MKQYVWLFTVIAALAVMMVGCAKKEGVDTAKLQKSFESADTQTQSAVSKAVVAIESDEYANALVELQKVAAQTKLTPEQQQAVKDALEQVKKKVGAKANEALGEVQKALPK